MRTQVCIDSIYYIWSLSLCRFSAVIRWIDRTDDKQMQHIYIIMNALKTNCNCNIGWNDTHKILINLLSNTSKIHDKKKYFFNKNKHMERSKSQRTQSQLFGRFLSHCSLTHILYLWKYFMLFPFLLLSNFLRLFSKFNNDFPFSNFTLQILPCAIPYQTKI